MTLSLNDTIQPLLDDLIANGDERGLQVAAYLDGRLVLDCWAGVTDIRSGQPVDGETLFPVFSVTKGVAATALHLLAERGQLDYDDPVVKHWPQFGLHGKEHITIRHCLSHTAGLYRMPDALNHELLGDWEFMVAALANAVPEHPPGERQVYHAMSYGWLIGELVRRIDGRDFVQFMNEELNAPLGIESLYCSIPDQVENRVAWLEEDTSSQPDNLAGNGSVPSWVNPLHAWMNREDARRACIPASSGIMSARAIARHYASLLPGGVDGVELLPPPAHRPSYRTANLIRADRCLVWTGLRDRRARQYTGRTRLWPWRLWRVNCLCRSESPLGLCIVQKPLQSAIQHQSSRHRRPRRN